MLSHELETNAVIDQGSESEAKKFLTGKKEGPSEDSESSGHKPCRAKQRTCTQMLLAWKNEYLQRTFGRITGFMSSAFM